MQIPLKKKYRGTPGVYGYSRNHSGNGAKRKKKLGVGYSDPYIRENHVKVLLTNGKTRFFHGEEARNLLGR